MKSEFSDNNYILAPKPISFDTLPKLHEMSHTMGKKYHWGHVSVKNVGFTQAYNLLHTTHGTVSTKMLALCQDGNEHHYRDICKQLFPDKNVGHDIDCWNGLIKKGALKFSSKHKYRSMYYKITSFGQEILKIADINQSYFRIMRWYKIDEDQMISEMMKADLNGEEAYKDQDPKTLVALLEQIFNPSSQLRTIGSAYRWMNNICNSLKKNKDFYEKMTSPEVMTWIHANKEKSNEVMKFFIFLSKAEKSLKKNLEKEAKLAEIEKEACCWDKATY